MRLLFFLGSVGTVTSGLVLLAETAGGRETLDTYRRAKTHLERYGTLDQRFKNRYTKYCDRKGIELAEKEAGLEEKLI